MFRTFPVPVATGPPLSVAESHHAVYHGGRRGERAQSPDPPPARNRRRTASLGSLTLLHRLRCTCFQHIKVPKWCHNSRKCCADLDDGLEKITLQLVS
jgi:hypothetical protein